MVDVVSNIVQSLAHHTYYENSMVKASNYMFPGKLNFAASSPKKRLAM
jgi:hypothetical protein